MRICIFGAGAVGGLVSAWLTRTAHDVSVIARGDTLQSLRRDGLRVLTPNTGEVLVTRPRVAATIDELPPQDVVFLAVKAHGLPGAAEALAPKLGRDTAVVTAMNGLPWWFFDRLAFGEGRLRLESMDPEGRLRRALPTERIVGCVVHFAASTPEPGLVSHNLGTRLILGEPGGEASPRLRRIADALGEAGFGVECSDAIEREYWLKLLGNICFNPVSALTVTTSDRMIEDPLVHRLLVTVMHEAIAIGRAVGVDPGIDPEGRMAIARVLGPFKTSMLQDLEAGKPLEVDGLLAGALEVATRAGVSAPFTEALYGLVRVRARATHQYIEPTRATP